VRSCMAHLQLSIALKAKASFIQQFRGHREVALGRGDIYMPQIGRQLRQQLLHVRTGAIPGDHSMNGREESRAVTSRQWESTALGEIITQNHCQPWTDRNQPRLAAMPLAA
jgi:hypothetical protein